MEKLLYTRDEAAALLQMSLPTLRCAIRRGMLQAIHRGRRVFFQKDEIERFAKLSTGYVWTPAAVDGSGLIPEGETQA